MTFREAIVSDALGGKLPLKWRRRVGKWQAWARAQARKMDQHHTGSHLRWSDWRFRNFLDEAFNEQTPDTK